MQPENKETGPGLLLPLMHLYKRYPTSTVAVFPSDHFIVEEDSFQCFTLSIGAFRVVQQDASRLVLLGVELELARTRIRLHYAGEKTAGSARLE